MGGERWRAWPARHPVNGIAPGLSTPKTQKKGDDVESKAWKGAIERIRKGLGTPARPGGRRVFMRRRWVPTSSATIIVDAGHL